MAVGTLVLSNALSAGAAEPPRWQIGGHVVAASPRGEFQDAVSDTRWGALGYFTRRLGETPLRAGVEVGAVTNGSLRVELDRRGGFNTTEARLSNDMLFGHFLFRVQPQLGRLSPFVEGAVGVRAFENSLFFENCVGACTVPTGESNVAFSAGGGVGLGFRLTEEGRGSGIALEARLRYLAGGTTEYYRESDLPELADELAPLPTRSRTDLVMISFGLVFDF